MSKSIPKYIGHPGYMQNADGFKNSDYGSSVNDAMDSSLQIVQIYPMDTQISKSINIYKGKRAWNEFTEYLSANDIDTGENTDHINVVCSNITPLSETYTNEFGQSELAGGLQSVTSGKFGEIAFATGWNSDSVKNAANSGGALGFLAGLADSGINASTDFLKGALGENNSADLNDFMRNPAQKIDIPSMWKGNSFSAQYEISVKLVCFNVNNEKEYNSKIIASLGALMQFVCPRSKQGKFYQWPFLMEFKLPGLVHLPLAYCSNMTVLKGGDVNDLSWKWRPNMIDVRMTINTIWGVTINSYNATADDGDRPTVAKELITLSDKKNVDNGSPSGSVTSGGSSTGSTSNTNNNTDLNARHRTTSEDDEAAVQALTS